MYVFLQASSMRKEEKDHHYRQTYLIREAFTPVNERWRSEEECKNEWEEEEVVEEERAMYDVR